MKRRLHKRDIYFADALRYAIVWTSVFAYLAALLDYFVLKPYFGGWQQLLAEYFAPIGVFVSIAIAMGFLLAVSAWRNPHWEYAE